MTRRIGGAIITCCVGFVRAEKKKSVVRSALSPPHDCRALRYLNGAHDRRGPMANGVRGTETAWWSWYKNNLYWLCSYIPCSTNQTNSGSNPPKVRQRAERDSKCGALQLNIKCEVCVLSSLSCNPTALRRVSPRYICCLTWRTSARREARKWM